MIYNFDIELYIVVKGKNSETCDQKLFGPEVEFDILGKKKEFCFFEVGVHKLNNEMKNIFLEPNET